MFNWSGNVDVVVDVYGYFVSTSSGVTVQVLLSLGKP
jgi:hypothetical protein